MGRTIIEKIMLKHRISNDEIAPGNIAWISLDNRTARDFGGANVVGSFEKNYEESTVNDASKTFFNFDCQVPANTIAYANNQQTCRKFAKKHDMNVFDVDAGIGSHIVIEKGYALPGTTTVGTDSHLNILGAVGGFGQGMGDTDIAFVFKTGKTWFEVPHSIKITLKGKPQFPTTPKDIILYLIGELGSAGALGSVVELYGDIIDEMDLSGRITLSSMGTEMGAIAIIIPPNNKILRYFRNLKDEEIEGVFADEDAKYVKELEFDISKLTPQIAMPPSPDNVKPVNSLERIAVNSVFMGSCTNGRYEDFLTAAELLGDGRKVAPGVMAKVVPATKEVFEQMMDTGLMNRYFSAGFIISNQGCGGCAAGQIGMTGHGEVQISTSNRNFRGKQGNGDTYLASPVTAVASALAGYIASPEVR